jgi:ABC-type dipeptide/oligopeptide/nickel transport system permease subunit
VFAAVLAPIVAPYSPYKTDLGLSLAGPSRAHLFGTDALGRDVLSRVIYGARVSLLVSFAAVFSGGVVGGALGLIAAYFRRCEGIILRGTDALLAMPDLIVALTVVAIIGSGTANIIFAIAIYQVPQYVRLVFGLAVPVKQRLFVEAASVSGESSLTILARYVLPNCLGPIIVQTTLVLPAAILTTATLSFIGLGIAPPTPEWGAMLQDGLTYAALTPRLVIVPGVALTLLILGFNLMGDGMADLLDPRARGRR